MNNLASVRHVYKPIPLDAETKFGNDGVYVINANPYPAILCNHRLIGIIYRLNIFFLSFHNFLCNFKVLDKYEFNVIAYNGYYNIKL